MAMSSRETYLYQARLAEQAERYEEMASFMQSLVETCVTSENEELGVDERNLLSVAYKNYVGCRRASWRIIISVEQKDKQNGSTAKEAIVKRYRERIEEELLTVCTTVLKLIDEHLLPHAENAESKVFYYKMKGDYYRYISEFAIEEHRENASNEALQAYQTATDLADKLHPTHPIRLGLALNFSVFYYEIKNMPSQACEMAKKAFDEGIISFDHMPPDAYKDSTLIMQLLRDNLTLWTSDLQADTSEKANLEADE